MTDAERTKQLEQATKYIAGQGSGLIEPWNGRTSPMVTFFLANKGMNKGPGKHETVKAFCEALLVSLKGSSFYIRFRFKVPDGSGSTKEQYGTLISVSKTGSLTFACRDRITANFTTEVDKVESATAPAGIEELIPETAGEVDLDNLEV